MYIFVVSLFMIACVVMIGSILLQSGKSAGMSGSIGGGAETLMGKTKARAMDKTFDKVSKAGAFGFIILSLVLLYLQK